MMLLRRSLTLGCLLLAFSLPLHAERPAILFSCSIPSSLPQFTMLNDIYTEAFDRLGYDFGMVYMNIKRDFAEHKHTDNYDGACIHLKTFVAQADEYKLILVDSPIGLAETSVWKNRQLVPMDNPDGPFVDGSSVGYLRGNILARNFIDLYPDVAPVSFSKPEFGIKTLAAGRVEYWVGFAFTAGLLVKKLQIEDVIEKVTSVREDYFYPFVNKKHQPLVNDLEQELARIMAARGSYVK